MADLSPITSWTLADVLHFGRRAGFGLNPTDAATLQALAPGAAIDAWIDGTGTAYDATAFTAALGTADVVLEPLVSANTAVTGSVDVAAVAAPHKKSFGNRIIEPWPSFEIIAVQAWIITPRRKRLQKYLKRPMMKHDPESPKTHK